LIELHLENLERFRTNISCGTVDDLTAREVLRDFSFFKISPIFSTCNALLQTQVLDKTGLFDQALDRKSNEDGELFIRMYLQGELMVLSPNTKIIHYHAPSGGLRAHAQRKITYASSRKSLIKRRLLNHAEFYILKRYYDQESIHESFLLSILGTFSIHGNLLKKMAKIFISLFLLPDTILKLAHAEKQAECMLAEESPDIPPFVGSA
jgi:GT2 family glycosyltransferase